MSANVLDRDFTDAEKKEIEQIQKLLNLANGKGNEAECASALSKANEKLVKMNLDAAMIENLTGTKSGKREKAQVEGGFFKHSRRLWLYVADLNFCVYWTQDYYIWGKRTRYSEGLPPIMAHIKKHRHAVVGRVVNVQATKIMATYLEAAINRILLDRLHGQTDQMYNDWSAGFRKGATARLIEMITERREAYLVQEKLKTQAAEKAARESGRVTTNRAITVSVFKDAEYDANIDFLYGEGTSAKRALERAERAAKRAADEAEYTEWAKANPKEAAAKEAIARKGRRSSGGRGSRGGSSEQINSSGYYAGYDAAEKISLDPQVGDGQSVVKIAGRR